MPSVPKDPDSLVTSFFESIQGHHLTAALDMMSQDCEYDNVPITKVFGRAAIEQTLGGFLAECSSYEWIIHHQVATGDLEHGVVMNERTDRFQIDGRWVELDVAGLFVVSESKIALWRDYFDRENFAKALANK
ncbi:MAG: nuclear transport factor 2 family protein [Ilumatobacteraceae bacterium]|jgi:limonene-1,2-epoxide hydrolase|nr:nuclear transport factor 2 family protein [Ilumatobacteraceae bacterium]MBJ7421865.1 nuclear transport factor 2 family protein [Ilumatobacteraceae bacterium]